VHRKANQGGISTVQRGRGAPRLIPRAEFTRLATLHAAQTTEATPGEDGAATQ